MAPKPETTIKVAPKKEFILDPDDAAREAMLRTARIDPEECQPATTEQYEHDRLAE